MRLWADFGQELDFLLRAGGVHHRDVAEQGRIRRARGGAELYPGGGLA